MAEIDSVVLTYTGLDLFEKAVNAAKQHVEELNRRAQANYRQTVDNALLNYAQKGVKTLDPMPQPPKALKIEFTSNKITLEVSDEPVAEFRDYPGQATPVAGTVHVGANMGDSTFPERFHVGAGDTIPVGRIVEVDGERFRKCGRYGFGGLLIKWYELQ
jgi:hypothetical protein